MPATFVAFLPLIAAGFIACIMYATTSRSRGRDSQGKFLGLLAVIICMGLILVVTGYNGIFTKPLEAVGLYPSTDSEKAAITGGEPEDKFYGIMFDAGSTGSRIHVFEFIDQGPGKPPKYLREEFQQVKPGLSSYAPDAKKGAESLQPLMDIANEVIPEAKRPHTHLALKATAGLRALPGDQSTAMINEVNMLFDKYQYKVSSDSVTIMEGDDEGKFSWFTVNFLAGVLGDKDNMVGVMDLGGGSTQVTFVPSSKTTVDSAPASYLTDVDIFGKDHRLYTHSYPLGLMMGRYRVLGGQDGQSEAAFTSPCFPPDFKDKFSFNNKEYAVSATAPSSSRYDECTALAKKAVEAVNIQKVEEVNSRPFWTISYYYDRAVESKLIDADNGGTLKVEDYMNSAMKECSSPNPETPWHCMDLCFISSLLQDGFGFKKDTPVTLRKKVEGTEIAWALGAMFDWFGRHKDIPAKVAGAR